MNRHVVLNKSPRKLCKKILRDEAHYIFDSPKALSPLIKIEIDECKGRIKNVFIIDNDSVLQIRDRCRLDSVLRAGLFLKKNIPLDNKIDFLCKDEVGYYMSLVTFRTVSVMLRKYGDE